MQTNTLGNSLDTRTVSSFPLSIGTGIAFETLFNPTIPPYDPNRQVPVRINIGNYNTFYINLETLFRNIQGSITKEAFIASGEVELKNILNFELEVIASLLRVEGGDICKPVFYYSFYDSLINHPPHPSIKFRLAKTELQQIYKFKFRKVIKLLLKERDDIIEYKDKPEPRNKTFSLIMTHIPYDLLSYTHFNKLDLLESHTGKIKSKFQWNSKYYPVGDEDLSMLPFIRKFLLIFGDRVLIQPNDLKLRKTILEVANKRKWTPMTTISKINQDFEFEIKEPYVLQFLRGLN